MSDMTATNHAAVLTEQRGRVLIVTLNRPDQRNSINGDLSVGLVAAMKRLDDDPGLTAGVLTGAGRGFCAGMDLKAFARGDDIGPFFKFVEHGTRKPLIGAVEGFALAGGLELALACDLLVASKGAQLGIPEVTVGLFAAAGGLLRLPGRVGYARAMQMALTGRSITAEDAAQHGLVAQLTDAGGALHAALMLADEIAANAPLAVAASKQLIRATQGVTEEDFWKLQASSFTSVFKSKDAKEGPRAFAEKRSPEWTGT